MRITVPHKKRKETKFSKLLKGARFEGHYELPIIVTSESIPKNVIAFDDAKSAKGKNKYNNWVHFYIYDDDFECIWNNPNNFLPELKKYQGVISPDFSLYRDAPLSEQLSNTLRNRTLGYWLTSNGIQVIPNVRWGDERSFQFCFDGIEHDSTVAIGTHGCVKKADDRYYYKLGLDAMVHRLRPKTIIVYGDTPKSIFSSYQESIKIIQFKSQFHISRNKEVE
jgi:hypothetical protein